MDIQLLASLTDDQIGKLDKIREHYIGKGHHKEHIQGISETDSIFGLYSDVSGYFIGFCVENKSVSGMSRAKLYVLHPDLVDKSFKEFKDELRVLKKATTRKDRWVKIWDRGSKIVPILALSF